MTQVLGQLAFIRQLLDLFRQVEPTESEHYDVTYDVLQHCYANILSAARRQRLTIEPWEGDRLQYCPLDGWVVIP